MPAPPRHRRRALHACGAGRCGIGRCRCVGHAGQRAFIQRGTHCAQAGRACTRATGSTAVNLADLAVQRAQRIADVAVGGALDHVVRRHEHTLHADAGTTAEEAGGITERLEQLPAIDRLAAAGGDAAGTDVVDGGALEAGQGQAVTAGVVIADRTGRRGLDRGDARVEITDAGFHRAHALVGDVELRTGDRVAAAGGDAAIGHVDDAARGRAIGAVATADRHHVGIQRTRSSTDCHRVRTGRTGTGANGQCAGGRHRGIGTQRDCCVRPLALAAEPIATESLPLAFAVPVPLALKYRLVVSAVNATASSCPRFTASLISVPLATLVTCRLLTALPTDTVLARSATEPPPSATLPAAEALALTPTAVAFKPVALLP
jgi:hypothetical protein